MPVTTEQFLEICDAIAEGRTLRSVCGREDMPSTHQVRYFVETNADARRAYDMARIFQAHNFFDEVVDNSRAAVDAESAVEVAGFRAALEGLKWAAERLAPGVYGQRASPSGLIELHIHTDLDLGSANTIEGEATGETFQLQAKADVPDADYADQVAAKRLTNRERDRKHNPRRSKKGHARSGKSTGK